MLSDPNIRSEVVIPGQNHGHDHTLEVGHGRLGSGAMLTLTSERVCGDQHPKNENGSAEDESQGQDQGHGTERGIHSLQVFTGVIGKWIFYDLISVPFCAVESYIHVVH